MKTKPFDLKLALLGHPLVTRGGKKVTGIRERSFPESAYPLEAKIGGIKHETFTIDGSLKYSDIDENDLFLKDCDWKPEPKMGDEILVSNDGKDWQKRIFIKLGVDVICVDCSNEDDFMEGYAFDTEAWEYWKWPEEEEQVPEYTWEEVKEKLGHEFKIKEK